MGPILYAPNVSNQASQRRRGLALGDDSGDAVLTRSHRRRIGGTNMGDKSPKSKERGKKQKTDAKVQVKAQKAAVVAAKAKK